MDKQIKPCTFCDNSSPTESTPFGTNSTSIKSTENDEIYYLNPNNPFWKNFRQDYHANIQVDINDSKYPDSRPGDSTSATFWFNYCPGCGRKLE